MQQFAERTFALVPNLGYNLDMKSKSKRGVYTPRTIDRAVFAVLAALHMLNGLYLVGPWYLVENSDGKAPLFALFDSSTAVIAYGVLLFLNGLALLYGAAGKGKNYTGILSTALLSGFLLRFYALIGVFIALEEWRPPFYLSHMATVILLASYWLWVRVCVRPTE